MPQSLIPPRGGPHAPTSPHGGNYETIAGTAPLNIDLELVRADTQGSKPELGTATSFAVWGALALCGAALVFTILALKGWI